MYSSILPYCHFVKLYFAMSLPYFAIFFGLSCIYRYGTVSSKTKVNETENFDYPNCYGTDTTQSASGLGHG